MRLAILSPFYPFRGGLAQLNARLFNELGKINEIKAFSFTTLYPNLLFPGKTQFVENSDTATIIENDRVLSSINPLSYISTAKAINKYSPDILIIPYWMSFLAPAFGTTLRLISKKIKVISLVHNAIPHEKHFFDTYFAKYFFCRCSAFIVMSEVVKNDLLSLIPRAKTILLSHPIYDQYKERYSKNDACLKLGIKSEKKNILFFGLIRDYKGLDLLIEAMDFLNEDYQLIIAGECYGEFNKYQDLIDKSRLKDNIIVFEQYIPDEMVTDLFSASDLLVLPYRSATQSGVVAMAYQLEMPMVATSVGALGSTIQDAKTGFVVSDIDSKSISEGIKTYFDGSEKDEYLKNIQFEKNRLSWNSFAENLQTFLEEVASN